jgi:hypothetical protein
MPRLRLGPRRDDSPTRLLRLCQPHGATWDLASPGQTYAALNGNDPVNNLLALIGNFQNLDPWCSVQKL